MGEPATASSNRASDKTRDDSKMAWDQVRDGVRFPDPQARNREQAAPSPRSGELDKGLGNVRTAESCRDRQCTLSWSESLMLASPPEDDHNLLCDGTAYRHQP